MMPRRRTKGSQVFTKAPTLTEESGNTGGKGLVSECATQSPIHPNPKGLLSLRKLLELLPHPLTWSTKGLGWAWYPR